MRTLRMKSARAAAAAGVLAFLGAMGGCNIVGGITYLAHGPEKAPAAHELDEKRKTVVFIDDTLPVVNTRANRVRIGTAAEQRLLDESKITMISCQDILAVAGRERASRQPMAIVDMGEVVGAEVVIYAQMVSFSLSPDGQTFAPEANVRIKVLDVISRERIWPVEPEKWYTLTVAAPPRQTNLPKNNSEMEAEYASLADRVGVAIGNVFLEHDPKPLDGRVDQ